MPRFCLLAILAFTVLVGPVTVDAAAATLPTGFTETQVASGLNSPTAMAFAPDGRLFVCLQGGQVRVIKNGALLATPFLTVTVNASGERGLLGIAFDPNLAMNNWVYVYYTATTPTIHNRVSRFTANGDVVVAGSETIILELDDLSSATNHNGGALHFGMDGKLYVAVGENANSANSQTLGNLLGKILRINSNGTIPTDNPFYTQTTGRNRAIWALGLRNPFTFAFDPFSGRMFINDVGQNAYEEINDGIVGANYGWPQSEGPTTNPNHRGPIYCYSHSTANPNCDIAVGHTGCAITGGVLYKPSVGHFPPEYVDRYFFADFCGGWINTLDPSSNTAAGFATGISSPVDLQLAADGSLYYLARGSTGVVYRIHFTGSQTPNITQQPQSQTVPAGQSVTFTVAASGTAPLSYQWQRNQTNIPGATSSSYTIASVTTADNGARFRCIVSNAAGSATSNEAILTVTASNSPPTATITQPAQGTLYTGGTTINYAGTGSDPQDGALPASAFTWQVDFHHNDPPAHVHPFVPATSGATSGSFTIPNVGETSANVFYRISLTVTDSTGLKTTTFRDVVPRTVTVTLSGQRSGLQLTLDGQPFPEPFTFVGVVGMLRTIGAPSPQTVGGFTYTFRSWSDDGAATHQIATPQTSTTYTARYRRSR